MSSIAPQIVKFLPTHLRATGEKQLGDEEVREICREYEVLLAALAEKTPCLVTDVVYRALAQLREELEQEIIVILTRLEKQSK